MSNTTFCSNCGKPISLTARFCRFCGTPTKRQTNVNEEAKVTPSYPTPPVKHPRPMPKPIYPPMEAVEKIPEEIIDILYARRRKIQIDNELKKMLEEIDDIGRKLEVGLIDEKESSEKITQLQSKISNLQEEKKLLKTTSLELEGAKENETQWKKRLEKLEEKKRVQAVSNEVYTTLRDEYTAELTNTNNKLATEERKARRWLVDLQKELRDIETRIERIKVRREIENLNDEEIALKTEQLTKEKDKKALAAEVLTEILEKL